MMFTVVVVLAGALIALGLSEGSFKTLRAAVALPLLLVLGLGSLLLILTMMVAVLDRFGLTDRRRAFGLPDGSMQAIIALALVLIFVIASLYLYSSLPQKGKSHNQNQFQFAQQLLTTVGTLAVAVAGFYFGTRSVEAARIASAEAARSGHGRLRLRWPRSPVSLARAAGTELAPILVDTEPARQAIRFSIVSGDESGHVERTAPGTYKYVRGSSAGDRVRLRFELEDGGDRQELVVTAPADGEAKRSAKRAPEASHTREGSKRPPAKRRVAVVKPRPQRPPKNR